MRHSSAETLSIAIPLSQLSPAPSPRIKRVLPKPISIFAFTIDLPDFAEVETFVATTAGASFLTTGFLAGTAAATAFCGSSTRTGLAEAAAATLGAATGKDLAAAGVDVDSFVLLLLVFFITWS